MRAHIRSNPGKQQATNFRSARHGQYYSFCVHAYSTDGLRAKGRFSPSQTPMLKSEQTSDDNFGAQIRYRKFSILFGFRRSWAAAIRNARKHQDLSNLLLAYTTYHEYGIASSSIRTQNSWNS